MIPGSMGTRSYIVVGKENPLSFHSAPHGAGRRYSRTKARALFTHGGSEPRDGKASSIATRRCCSTRFPALYKDIDEVIEQRARSSSRSNTS